MLRDNENWLRYRVDQTIGSKHSGLLKNVRNKKIKNFFNEYISTKRWYITVGLTILMFVLGMLFFHLFTLSKDSKNGLDAVIKDIGAIIEARTSNLSTVAGLSLAVIGFLMGNIAVKESYAFQIVLEKTKFFTVIVAVLSALVCFVIIGTFKVIFKPSEWYLDLMLSSMFIFIGILVLIGYIFGAAIRYTNPNRIDELVNEIMLLNASLIIYKGAISRYSLQEYRNLMCQRECRQYQIGTHFDSSLLDFSISTLTADSVKAKEAKQVYITDIDMIGLSAYLHCKKDQHLFYHDLYIGLQTDNLDNYAFHLHTENDKLTKKSLKKFIRWTRDKKEVLALSELREHYDTRLVEYSEAGKEKELERLLKGLSKLYELQMTFQYGGEFDLTKGLENNLADALTSAIRKKNLACFRHLLTFCSANCFKAIEMLDLNVFTNMLNYYPQVFNIVKVRAKDSSYQDFLPLALDPAGFYELFLYKISEQKKQQLEKIKTVNEFGKQAYRAYNLLLYYMISLKDFTGLQKAIELLYNSLGDEPDYKSRTAYLKALNKTGNESNLQEINTLRQQFIDGKALQVYKQHTLFSIKAWIFHLRRWNKLNIEEIIALTTAINVPYRETEDVLDDILYFRQGIFHYFTWQSWVFPDYFESGETGISDPGEWLTFGFMAEQIIRFQLPVFNSGLQLQKIENISFLISQLKRDKIYFIDHFAEWKEILKVSDLSNLQRKADAVISFFERLEEAREQTQFRFIADSPVKPKALNEFRKIVAEQWKKETGIYQLFGEFDTASLPLADAFIGLNQFIPDVKQFFVKYSQPSDIQILADLGSQAGRLIDEKFFLTVINKQTNHATGTLLKIVSSSIEELKDRGIKPDSIFVSATRLYTESDFLDDKRFVKKDYDGENEQISFLKGWFSGVPIYSSFANALKGFTVITSFKNAFKGVISPKVNLEEIPMVETITFSRTEAEILAKAQSQSEAATENSILRLQNGIQLKIGIDVSFDVINGQALVVGELMP